MSDDSNTDAEQTQRGPIRNAKPFVKGDPRINRKGRPKTFDGLRAEAIKIAGEILTSPDKQQAISRAHAMLLDWATSKNVRKQQLFIEYAFGKVPTQTEITGAGGGPIETKSQTVFDYTTVASALAPRSVADSEPSGQVEICGDGETVG